MVFVFHKAPEKGNAGSGNFASVYRVSLEMDDNEEAYILIDFSSGTTRPVGVWDKKDFEQLEKKLKFSLDKIPVFWKNESEGPYPIDISL